MNKRTNEKCISWLHCHNTSEIAHDRAKTTHGRACTSVKKHKFWYSARPCIKHTRRVYKIHYIWKVVPVRLHTTAQKQHTVVRVLQ